MKEKLKIGTAKVKQTLFQVVKKIAFAILGTWGVLFSVIGILSVIVGYALLIISPFMLLFWLIKYLAS